MEDRRCTERADCGPFPDQSSKSTRHVRTDRARFARLARKASPTALWSAPRWPRALDALVGCLDSEDTRVMVGRLARLGITVDFDRDAGNHEVEGCGGRIPGAEADLYVANSGTTVRFLTAMFALGPRDVIASTARRGCASGRSMICSRR